MPRPVRWPGRPHASSEHRPDAPTVDARPRPKACRHAGTGRSSRPSAAVVPEKNPSQMMACGVPSSAVRRKARLHGGPSAAKPLYSLPNLDPTGTAGAPRSQRRSRACGGLQRRLPRGKMLMGQKWLLKLIRAPLPLSPNAHERGAIAPKRDTKAWRPGGALPSSAQRATAPAPSTGGERLARAAAS